MGRLMDYYALYDEDIRLEKDKAHKIEFITSTNFLNKVIKKNSCILDVGAATGKYSFYYAGKGNMVTAVDLSPKNIEVLKRKWELCNFKNNLNFSLGDARDLSDYESNSFDTVLCMGPIYHLADEEDKMKCIDECVRVLRPGGILAVAYINKFAVCVSEVKRNTEKLFGSNLNNIISKGIEFGDNRDVFYFTSPKEIAHLLNNFNIEKIENIATDGVGYLMSNIINNYTEEEFEQWVKHHLDTCREESILGYSLHGLFICRKIN